MQSLYVSRQLLDQFTEFYEMFREVMKHPTIGFFAIRVLLPSLLAVCSHIHFMCSLLHMIGRVSQSYKKICNIVHTRL